MKFSKKFNRDYDFYIQNKDTFTFSGVNVTVWPDLENGVTAKECFWRFDSTGNMMPTCEPDLLKALIICKKSINLHITLWVEGYDDMMEGVEYYMGLFHGTPPLWVEDSFRKQLLRKIQSNKVY